MKGKKQKLNEVLLNENVVQNIRDNLGLILELIPEIRACIGFEHMHPHHNLDVFEHTLKALSMSRCDLEIRMALLFHDIGKPYSYVQKGNIRHFKGHPHASALITRGVLTRLKYNKKFIENVVYLVEKHDELISTENLDNSLEMIKKRLEVQYADAKAHEPSKVERRLKILDSISDKINKMQ